MKLSEKLFLWFSAMTAVMLVLILLLAGLQKQGIVDVAAVFHENKDSKEIIQITEAESIQDPVQKPEELPADPVGAPADTPTEPEETIPSVVIDVSEQKTTEAVPEEPDPYPYYIKVNKTQNCVTIYEKDDAGEYTVPLKAMVCSTGYATPTGVFGSKGKYLMQGLINGVYGQYSTWITGNILFHSVPSSRRTKDSLIAGYYNQLGTTASAGCIRLTVEDAKWIYDNCEIGTLIEIYNDSEENLPLGKPEAIKLPEESRWDPTDPDPENPWHESEPLIMVEERIILYYGQPWTPYEDITAIDTCGNDVTEKVMISGGVDTYTPGYYGITFSLTDALGREAEAECEYLVIPTPYAVERGEEDPVSILQ